eukprot:scaffold144716_cov61-Attheya_sp.AAC.5
MAIAIHPHSDPRNHSTCLTVKIKGGCWEGNIFNARTLPKEGRQNKMMAAKNSAINIWIPSPMLPPISVHFTEPT